MPKILNILQRGNPAEHWANASAFNEKDIEKIKDPSGLTDKKQITSIPSPFARIDLFKTAFRALVDNATDNLDALDGNTIHHKLVSDCLDMIQLFFEWDTFSEDPSKRMKVVTWNKQENLEMLINSGNPAHQLLGETLKLFFEQDREAYNFDELEDFYLIEYDYKIIGGTSPVTMCFTTANSLDFVNLNVGRDKFFDREYAPLYQREKEFQKFLHFMFKAEPRLRENMKELFDYIELSLKKLAHSDPRLRDDINAQVRNFKVNDFKRNYPVINTGKEGQDIYILGVEMRKKRVDKGSVSGESDFIIASTKWDEKFGQNGNVHKPLVLQNNYSKRRMKYIGGGDWERNTTVPYSYGNTPLNKRILPGQNMAYPHLTVDDFLEPTLIKLVYPLNHKFFNGNMVGFKQNHVGFLIPIKKTYFDYFDVDDLRKTTIDGDRVLEMSDRAGGGVAVTLRIPIAKSGEYITLERMYYPNNQPEISAEQNKGSIMECQFSLAIFPFIKLTENNQYRVVLVDRDIKETTRHLNYNLHFYKQDNTSKQLDNPSKIRSEKSRDEMTSKFYMVNEGFDFIEVENGEARGMMIPFFDRPVASGTKRFSFAVDFGTTNTHAEYSIEGSEPKPMEIKEEDKQFVTSYPVDYNIFKAPELSLTILREFAPQIIAKGTEYSFPFRTTISEHETLNHSQPVHALADLNIPFYYEKMVESRGTDIYKEIKWSNFGTEDDARNRVEKFMENLLFMMRNKVILNQGNLSKTELIWFFPSSMTPTQQDDLEEMWREQFEKYFPEVNDVDANLRKMSESLAPFHYYKEYERVDSLAYPVVSIDIGGGTTDIVVFFDNKPKFITSFKFAGNAMFGDAYNSSPRYNGFVRRYKEKIRGLLTDNVQPDLLRVMENLDSERSQEMISFFFSLDGNQSLKEADINIGFSKMLKDDGDLKVVFLLFYGAIIYHVAKMMKNAGLDLPRYICFSGNGSRSINLLDSSRKLRRVSQFAKHLFEEVYNEGEENKEEENRKSYRYGEARQAGNLEIKQVQNPKEVTCKGGLLGATGKEIEDMKMVLLGTKDNLVVNSKIDNVASEKMRYEDLNHDVYDEVIGEIEGFVEMLFDLDDEYSFDRNLGIKMTDMEKYKRWLFEDLRQYLMQGIESKTKNDLANNTKARVEETLFFYPLVGALNNLASKVVD
jgi:hypothetical protein